MASIELHTVFTLLGMHFLADFTLQPRKVITFRGNLPRKIITHCISYALPFAWFGAQFAVLVFFLHIFVDSISDRVLGRLWEAKRARWHMLVVGLDQTTHMMALFFVYWLVGVDYAIYNTIKYLF